MRGMSRKPDSRHTWRAIAILTLALSVCAGAAIAAVRSYTATEAAASQLTRLCAATQTGAAAIPLAIHSTIGPRTVAPGGVQVRYDISIQRGRAMISSKTAAHTAAGASVTMSIASPLPGGVVASFSPRVTRAAQSSLSVSTGAKTRVGTYQIGLTASGRLKPGGAMRSASTCVTLDVVKPPSFAITGTTSGILTPGIWRGLELQIRNKQRFGLLVSGLTVHINAIRAPRAKTGQGCTAADFLLQQYSGKQPLTLAPLKTFSLSALKVPLARRPRIAMADRPVNQDGCEQATLTLGFTATARKSGT